MSSLWARRESICGRAAGPRDREFQYSPRFTGRAREENARFLPRLRSLQSHAITERLESAGDGRLHPGVSWLHQAIYRYYRASSSRTHATGIQSGHALRATTWPSAAVFKRSYAPRSPLGHKELWTIYNLNFRIIIIIIQINGTN